MPELNHTLFSAINGAIPSQTLWMSVTNSGSVAFVGCLLFIALRNNLPLLINALLCALIAHCAIKFAKYAFSVLRPEHNLTDLITLGPPLEADNYSMPSGHTTTAFIAAIFIARAYSLQRTRLWLLLGYAGLIGVSRIAVGAHWPSDVAAGAGLGILLGWLFSGRGIALAAQNSVYLSGLAHLLYLPFFAVAISRGLSITSPATAVSEGIILAAGVIAFIFWILSIAGEFNKYSDKKNPRRK